MQKFLRITQFFKSHKDLLPDVISTGNSDRYLKDGYYNYYSGKLSIPFVKITTKNSGLFLEQWKHLVLSQFMHNEQIQINLSFIISGTNNIKSTISLRHSG